MVSLVSKPALSWGTRFCQAEHGRAQVTSARTSPPGAVVSSAVAIDGGRYGLGTLPGVVGVAGTVLVLEGGLGGNLTRRERRTL